MKVILTYLTLAFGLIGYAQEGARGSIATKNETVDPGQKRALVVGISDYTEADLKLLFPKKSWNKLHLQIIYFAR